MLAGTFTALRVTIAWVTSSMTLDEFCLWCGEMVACRYDDSTVYARATSNGENGGLSLKLILFYGYLWGKKRTLSLWPPSCTSIKFWSYSDCICFNILLFLALWRAASFYWLNAFWTGSNFKERHVSLFKRILYAFSVKKVGASDIFETGLSVSDPWHRRFIWLSLS